jgi:hypothetical protein
MSAGDGGSNGAREPDGGCLLLFLCCFCGCICFGLCESPFLFRYCAGLAEAFLAVAAEIKQVEAAITAAEEKAEAATTERDQDYWRKKEEQLRKKEEQLRKEKEQLRAEKALLLQKELAGGVSCLFSVLNYLQSDNCS